MYPKPYIEFMAHFHGTRDYFECHEILEEYWKEVDPKNRASVWVLLIQVAVSMYHDRRGNQKGAKTLLDRCIKKAPENYNELKELGLDPEQFFTQLQEMRERLMLKQPYRSWNLPVVDLHLRKKVQQLCQKWHVAYGSPSNLADEYLVYKHKLRNRL